MSHAISRRATLLSGAGALLTAGLWGRQTLAQADALRIGTSSLGSVFYTVAVGAGEIIREIGGVNTTVQPVGGSAANINALARGDIDLAIVNAFAAYSASTGSFDFPSPIPLRLLLQGQPSFRYPFIRSGAGIRTPKDLEGRTIVGERRALPEIRLLLDALIAHFDLDASTMNIVATTNLNEALDAMRAGSVDAAILPFSEGEGVLAEATGDNVLEFLPITEADRDAILANLPEAFFAQTLAAGLPTAMAMPIRCRCSRSTPTWSPAPICVTIPPTLSANRLPRIPSVSRPIT